MIEGESAGVTHAVICVGTPSHCEKVTEQLRVSIGGGQEEREVVPLRLELLRVREGRVSLSDRSWVRSL
jgi:hypothetical protein